MLDSLRPALLITRREVRDQMRDWRIIFPIAALTIFFPFLMNFTARQALDFVQRYGASIIGERMVPFLLMIVGFFPVSVSLVIALETFVGERERGSIEPLLSTPLKDWQLYLGKLLSATVPPLISSFLGMGVYLAGLYFNHVPIPDFHTLVQIVILTVIQALVMVSGAVVVSTQATSVRAANLLASFIIIPAALLIQGESVLMFWGTNQTLWWAVLGLVVLAVLLVRVGLAHFQREELLGREIDVLNLRWGWKVFWGVFREDAVSLKDWYRRVVAHTLKRLWLPSALVFCLVLAGVWVGARQTANFPLPLQSLQSGRIDNQFGDVLRYFPLFSVNPVLAIWWQNVRVMLIGLLLGIFTFGVLGVLPVMLSMGLVGYLMGSLALGGSSPWLFFGALILPHGIIEIPAAILATAAVLRMGAILAAPAPGKTVGEVWLSALADWFKVMVAAVIPLLLIAAAIEAWVTPRIALFFLH
jgi:uncharacterized membrane protein SpoIIM required for sporulation/ABC-type transport system involved in multi-copper enzyme maturation permease subunit